MLSFYSHATALSLVPPTAPATPRQHRTTMQHIQSLYGDGRTSENPQEFLKSFNRLKCITRATLDEEKIEALDDYLVYGSCAEEWYMALNREVVKTWSQLVAEFNKRWPPLPPADLAATAKRRTTQGVDNQRSTTDVSAPAMPMRTKTGTDAQSPHLYTTTPCQVGMPSVRSYATVSCQTDEPPQHINAGTDAPLRRTYTTSQCQTDAPPRRVDASTNAQSPSTRNTAHSQMEPIPADTQRHTESLSPARTAPRSQDPHGDVPPPHAERPSRSRSRRKRRTQSLRLPSEAPIDMESPRRTTSHPPYL